MARAFAKSWLFRRGARFLGVMLSVFFALAPLARADSAVDDVCSETVDLMKMDLAFLEPLNQYLSDRADNLNSLENACVLFEVTMGEVDGEPIVVSGYIFEEEYIESYIEGRAAQFDFTRTQAVIYYLKTQPVFLLKRLKDYLSLVADGTCTQDSALVKKYLAQTATFIDLVNRLPKPADCTEEEPVASPSPVPIASPVPVASPISSPAPSPLPSPSPIPSPTASTPPSPAPMPSLTWSLMRW